MRMKIVLGLTSVIFALLACSFATAQTEKPASDKTEKQNSTVAKPAAAGKPETKQVLIEATRVSTSDAVKATAREAKKKSDADTSSADSAVTEFRPATQKESSSEPAVVAPAKDAKKSVLKSVHGSVHGSTAPGAPGNHDAGGAVGGSSKSGKTSVYVETERSRDTVNSSR